MAHADHGGPGQVVAQEPVEMGFDLLVHRGRGLVEEEPVRLLQERAREGDPLLLTGRQGLRPVGGLAEPRGQLR